VSPARGRGAAGRQALLRRLLLLAAVVLGGSFAVMGGEYSTFDLLTQRRQLGAVQGEVASLQREVDSLAAWKDSIETDPGVQERLAREQFGMVRGDKELLYRLPPEDSAR
jgi:cell division protein FtsB